MSSFVWVEVKIRSNRQRVQFYTRCASAPHKAWGQRCNKTRPHPGPAAAELYNWPESLSPCRVCAAVMNGACGISISFPLVAAKSAHSASSLAAKETKKMSSRGLSPFWREEGARVVVVVVEGEGGFVHVSAIVVHVIRNLVRTQKGATGVQTGGRRTLRGSRLLGTLILTSVSNQSPAPPPTSLNDD